jgi:hypothetical protein
MMSDGQLVGMTACSVFPKMQARGDFSRSLLKTIDRAWGQSSLKDSNCERWLLISDDSAPQLLEAYRRAYRQISNATFQKIFLMLPDGRVEDLSG